MALLNSLLVAGDEGDSLRAIIRIPTAPLLYYLESCEASPGTDSGVESCGHRDTVGSLDTCYSSDMASSTTDEGVGGANLLALPTGQDGTRCSSFLSEASESSSGGRTLLRWVWLMWVWLLCFTVSALYLVSVQPHTSTAGRSDSCHAPCHDP